MFLINRSVLFLLSELEALEACYWLKATGFSSYVKMYEGVMILIILYHLP